MLLEHDRQRSGFPRHAVTLQFGEQQVFLLAVIAGIGEEPDEGDAVFDGREVQSMVGLPVQDILESSRNLEDPFVLFSESCRGGLVFFHGRVQPFDDLREVLERRWEYPNHASPTPPGL